MCDIITDRYVIAAYQPLLGKEHYYITISPTLKFFPTLIIEVHLITLEGMYKKFFY